jgi:hypothetical protein
MYVIQHTASSAYMYSYLQFFLLSVGRLFHTTLHFRIGLKYAEIITSEDFHIQIMVGPDFLNVGVQTFHVIDHNIPRNLNMICII